MQASVLIYGTNMPIYGSYLTCLGENHKYMVNNHSIMAKNETIAILQHLLEHKQEEYSIRELAKIRNVNYKTAYQAIHKLHKQEAANIRKKGNTKLCSANNKLTLQTYQAEKHRLQEILQNSNLRVIYNELRKINTQFIALLFGSYVTKQATKHSDIDLLIVTNNSQPIQEQLELLPLNIHLTPLTYEEYIQCIQQKTFNVANEAHKHNIPLIGLEDYYRLQNNAL